MVIRLLLDTPVTVIPLEKLNVIWFPFWLHEPVSDAVTVSLVPPSTIWIVS